ncbi:siderophore biosynthesis protein [Kocuria coralli]|uniref:Siderophore biosynthesis protein n=1 Tax=Kocuria coralli TaxID=1461025 RepID=A0A5J5KYQ6_9MICC|nr:IucA/IucC family protein [Kocuria coralli]KAA9394045.1 siderophore biosynthesis protein [Kocuria coralli]
MNTAPTGLPPLSPAVVDSLQRAMLAKLFGEFAHERILTPRPDRHSGRDGWVVDDDGGQPRWFFTATVHPLEHWRVDPASIRRLTEDGSYGIDPQQAVLDLRETLGLTDRVLPLYLEDLSATLLTAVRRREWDAPSSRELTALPLEEVERHLDGGHPGFVASSGRVGMGAAQQRIWAPEAHEPARLVWVAARRSLCAVAVSAEMTEADHHRLHLLPEEREAFTRAVREAGEDPEHYTPIPVHPWQWEHRLLPGLLPDILRRDLILVGPSSHTWRAQQSVRTFLDVEDTTRDYAKTALGVHSMGFLRGLSPAYMKAMPAISDWLEEFVDGDEFLRECGVEVLRERSSVGYLGDAHHRSGVKSDHTKQLAALWRESPTARLAPGEQAASLAGVLHVDREGVPLIQEWIQFSGRAPAEWAEALLRVYLAPVAHLLLARNTALMPHGENVILRLRDGFPVGAFWKDLGEEVGVLDDQPLPEGLERLRSMIDPEERELAVHTDVVDGVLRHLAALLHAQGILDEAEFWTLAAEVLDEHRARYPRLWQELDLFRPSFVHSCLNRLQLRDPQAMVDRTDPSGSLITAGRLENPLSAYRRLPAGTGVGASADVSTGAGA